MGHAGVRPAVAAQRRAHDLLRVVELGRVFREADEDQAREAPYVDPMQRVRRLVEILVGVASRAEGAVELVAPRVVGADEHLRVALRLVAHVRAAVAAHVQQGMHHRIPTAHHDEGFARDFVDEVVAGRRNAALVTDAQPPAHVNPLDISRVDGRVRVELLQEREARGLPCGEFANALVEGRLRRGRPNAARHVPDAPGVGSTEYRPGRIGPQSALRPHPRGLAVRRLWPALGRAAPPIRARLLLAFPSPEI